MIKLEFWSPAIGITGGLSHKSLHYVIEMAFAYANGRGVTIWFE